MATRSFLLSQWEEFQGRTPLRLGSKSESQAPRIAGLFDEPMPRALWFELDAAGIIGAIHVFRGEATATLAPA